MLQRNENNNTRSREINREHKLQEKKFVPKKNEKHPLDTGMYFMGPLTENEERELVFRKITGVGLDDMFTIAYNTLSSKESFDYVMDKVEQFKNAPFEEILKYKDTSKYPYFR